MKENIEQAGEIWYQRAKKLARYFQDNQNEPVKRMKAYLLYKEMEKRVLNVANLYAILRLEWVNPKRKRR